MPVDRRNTLVRLLTPSEGHQIEDEARAEDGPSQCRLGLNRQDGGGREDERPNGIGFHVRVACPHGFTGFESDPLSAASAAPISSSSRA
jgi:hypothetical protein